MTLLIGLDFDNTLADYNDVFVATAIEWELLPPTFKGNKLSVCDTLRATPDGEKVWQKLQGYIYGSGIGGARLYAGVDAFFREILEIGARVTIVSHKTEFGHADPDRINLRDAALEWMGVKGFFNDDGFALSRTDVHFAANRDEKIACIAALQPNVFVDDLAEVLTHPNFPPETQRILFGSSAKEPSMLACSDWGEVTSAILNLAARSP